MMTMRPSRVLKKLRAGQPAFCTKINTGDARVAEIAAISGFDCVWLDREHCPNDLRAIEEQTRACLMHNADVMVRVPRGSYSELIWPFEMNATAIMVPHVMSAADAKHVARMTKFHPVGRRPLDGGNADGLYCGIGTAEYTQQANRERLVIIQIEDPEPMEELDAIAATPGIDMLLFGPGDFAHGCGVTGELNHPKVVDARKKVVEACKRHNKFASTVASIEVIPEYIAMGYQFLNVGADVLALMKYFGDLVAQLPTAGPAASTAATPYGSTR